MAEMTAAEAVRILKQALNKNRPIIDFQAAQIAALIEQQAQEIAKKDRMIEKACELLSNTGCPGLEDTYCDENCKTAMNGGYCWRKWLEKEAEGVEYDGR